MKQYERIWVPNDLDQLATKFMLIGPDHHYPLGGLDQKDNVIVLTLKEAEDIWDAGARGDRMKNVPDAKYTTFKSWMEYKGVKI